jgi:hypothetical protein
LVDNGAVPGSHACLTLTDILVRTPPQVFEFTPEQANLAAAWSPGEVSHWVFLEIFPEPGTRPRIRVADPKMLPHHRVSPSIEYLDEFVSGFILHPNYFHRYADRLSSGPLTCMVQVGDWGGPVLPSSTFCSDDRRVTLIPDLTFWHQRGYFYDREQVRKLKLRWSDRTPVAFWRGSSTGPHSISAETFPKLPRFRLCSLSLTRLRGLLDARFTAIVQDDDEADAERLRQLAQSLNILAPRVLQEEFARYRYLIDIDGNTNSWSLLLKLAMGSCILKVQSPYRQWYYGDLRPWKHYVPIRADLSDLEGKILWCRKHDGDARQIAEEGKRFADERVFGAEMARAASVLLGTALQLPTDPYAPFISHPSQTPGLEIEMVHDGCVVRQPELGKIHHLNPSAAVVLEACNGTNSEAELPTLVQLAYKLTEPPVASVMACLERFKNEGLIT